MCHFGILSISKIKHCMLKQKHFCHSPWKYLAIEMCSKSLCTLQCYFPCICNLKTTTTKNPLTFTDSSSTKHLRKCFSSDAFIHRIKNMQIFKPGSYFSYSTLVTRKIAAFWWQFYCLLPFIKSMLHKYNIQNSTNNCPFH